MNHEKEPTDTLVAQTKHLRLVDRNGWSFVERIGSTGVVCIVAKTVEDRLVLVEQYRPPVRERVIELPAGLAGDLDDQADESLEQAAQRELLEETGYAAGRWTRLVTVASSAGLTDETVTMFLAEDLERLSSGGGDASEDILIHEVPLADAPAWLHNATASGKLVDSRVYAALYFLNQHGGR
ncbi:MAG: NUDIX hydrolase [Pirellulales bacterium]|nr:NUDIX hydrolase [Pirellulales bacterium]